MDLRVSQRLVRPCPVSDTGLLTPLPHQLHLGHLSLRPCAQFSEQQLHQRIQFSMEQRQREEEEEKRQELQQLWHKDKSQQSAVASSAVKKKLQEVILKKRQQQVALEQNNSNPLASPQGRYQDQTSESDVTSQTLLVSSHAQPSSEGSEDTPLRRTASEPKLTGKQKLKKHLNRKSPLTRKESAPPPVKHRASDPLDSSPSSSSTPVSGCSSPSDSLSADGGVLPSTAALANERLLLQDGLVAHFTVHRPSTLPTITLGLPANAKSDVNMSSMKAGRVSLLSGSSSVFVPVGLEESSSLLSSHLQPMLVLEPNTMLHPQLLTVPGLGHMPLSFGSQLEHMAPVGPRKPLSRTRSEPLPQSQRSIHSQLLQQHHSSQLLERLQQQTCLGKLMSKNTEKHCFRQIPVEDMDSEEVEQLQSDTHQSRMRTDLLHKVESVSTSEIHEENNSLQHRLLLSQQSLLWEKQKQLRQQATHMEMLAVPMVLRGTHRALSRTQSSPASTSLPLSDKALPLPSPETVSKPQFTTGLVYDSQMLKHQCNCGDNSSHPEHAGRIQSIWSRLQERGLRSQCETIQGKKASLEELQSVHSERHVLLYGTNPLNRLKLDHRKLSGILSQRMFVMLTCGGVGVDNDTIWNEMHTSTASRIAAGSVTELAFRVAKGELKNGFAVVRPPGHHATHSTPMGFCFFNSVAIAAKQLQQKLNVSKILIVDWDVHHGNGTQEAFYSDPSVLYISLHRYDDGNFFPGSGGPAEVGSGAGEGFNVNVAWIGGLNPPMGDADYLAAFRTVVMPIAQTFAPDVVLVSSGFDAAEGHPPPLGGYRVSARCFGYMTQQLMQLAGGRVVLVLEGGYDLTAICDASEACVSALLGVEVEPLPEDTLRQSPSANGVRSLQRVLQVHGHYWPTVKRYEHTVALSFRQAQEHEHEENATVTALASLSVGILRPKRVQDEPMDHGSDSL
ncbi:histone deacetylase 7-like isoform X1 [Scleropages formosus]|uniref:Histone deacetylase n=1 Tax=Scleropages formosus TaxID=113540 RepID=A0A8C9SA27_SCLFO|nr:histone deacetylase 7-like isoform X1 [Scleropages formosus]XP_018581264.1 histone deacetylase 7-like isoform X1 [Scleropages formosus]XP_018581265.1 histone deacetylase 7-like isoform X1 [Scleropages formosus]XP_018581266.1 histone deacetylase 7-like isoform X1 [Scleropages formosus]